MPYNHVGHNKFAGGSSAPRRQQRKPWTTGSPVVNHIRLVEAIGPLLNGLLRHPANRRSTSLGFSPTASHTRKRRTFELVLELNWPADMLKVRRGGAHAQLGSRSLALTRVRRWRRSKACRFAQAGSQEEAPPSAEGARTRDRHRPQHACMRAGDHPERTNNPRASKHARSRKPSRLTTVAGGRPSGPRGLSHRTWRWAHAPGRLGQGATR